MSTRINLYYDPAREGYDNSTWHTLTGGPSVLNNTLNFSGSVAVGYGDMLRGDHIFNIKIPLAPVIGNDYSWGLKAVGADSSILFSLTGGGFTVSTTTNGVTTSVPFDWSVNWTTYPTEFRIRWEAGTAKFYAGGTFIANITDDTVPNVPLSWFISNLSQNSSHVMELKYVQALGVQTYNLVVGPEDSVFETKKSVFDSVTMQDVVFGITVT